MPDLDFFKGKRVLITGHTGFKGSWMTKLLVMKGALVTGYALLPSMDPNLFSLTKVKGEINSVEGDVRDLEHLQRVFNEVQPEIVIHLAAQPLVRESYLNPVYTYETNVMGTVNVCEAVRKTPSVKSFVNVTTDKVYLNKEWNWGYRENEELNGYDPYSNSKSCSELVTGCYINSFFKEMDVAVSTVRAGNVLGGGDFATDRIIPDCIRAIKNREDIVVRNPYSTRPYQHVLEPIVTYLTIAAAQYSDKEKFSGAYNVGPNEEDCLNTGKLVSLFCDKWNKKTGDNIKWVSNFDGGPHEANFLKLDCSKLKAVFDWKPVWSIEESMEKIVEWYEAYLYGKDHENIMEKQINEFLALKE